MIKKVSFLLLVILVCAQSFAQSNKIQIVVFDTDGKIVKSFGEENGFIIEDDWKNKQDTTCFNRIFSIKGFRLVVEKVPSSEAKRYFLRYQFRKNDYIHESNMLEFADTLISASSTKWKNLVWFDIPTTNTKDKQIISYQLIKTNAWGDETNVKTMFQSLNWSEYYQAEIVEDVKNMMNGMTYRDLKSAYDTITVRKGVINKVKLDLKSYKDSLEKMTSSFGYRKKKIQAKIDINKTFIEKVSQLDQADGFVKSIDRANHSLKEYSDELIDLISDETDTLSRIKTDIKELEKKQKNVEKKYYNPDFLKKYSNWDNLVSNISIPAYKILHQGTLIYNSDKTREIVYEYYEDTIPSTKKVNVNFIRQTPDFPLITTDQVLYAKIVNATPDALKDFRFFANLKVDDSKKATEWDLQNGLDIKAIEKLETGIDFLPRNISSVKSYGVPLNEQIKLEIDTIITISMGVNTIKLLVGTSTDPFIERWFTSVNKNSFSSDSLEIYIDSLKNEADGKKITLEDYEKLKKAVEKINLILAKQAIISFCQKVIQKQNDDEAKYIDYVLKYPKTFQYLTVPKVELYANTYYAEDYKVDVKEGEEEKPSFTLKKQFYKVVEDELPIVRKKYRFALNAGVAYTTVLTYTYTEQLVAGTQDQSSLQERNFYDHRFVPTLFLSTYIKKTDVYNPNRTFLETLHIDVGIDYADTDVLDNFYVGAGWEPWRNVHVSSGVRLGSIERIDLDKVNPYTLDTSNAKYSEFCPGFYIAVNFGFSLIPTAINSLLNVTKP